MVTATRRIGHATPRSAAVEQGMDGQIAARENVEQDRPERARLLRHRNRIAAFDRCAQRSGHPVMIEFAALLVSDVEEMLAHDVRENRNHQVVVSALEAATEYAEYGNGNAA